MAKGTGTGKTSLEDDSAVFIEAINMQTLSSSKDKSTDNVWNMKACIFHSLFK